MGSAVRVRAFVAAIFAASTLGVPAPALAVDLTPSTTTLTALNPPHLAGYAVLLRARVDSSWLASSSWPTGSVEFWETTSGTPVLLDTVAVQPTGSLGDSEAYYQASLDAGTHKIVAEYLGDPDRAGSSSTEISVVVEKAAPTVEIGKYAAGTPEANSPFQIHAWLVGGQSGFSVDATMTFTRVGSDTPICVVPVESASTTVCTVPGLPQGTHSFVATYSGNDTHAGASSQPFAVTVGPDTVHATGVGVAYTTFYPVKDTYRDTVAIKGTRDEPIAVTIKIYNPNGTLIKTVNIAQGSGAYSYAWNGRKSDGTIYAAGKYKIVQTLKDAAGTTKAFTSYVTLSKKKATIYTKTVTKLGSSFVAKGYQGGTVTKNTTSGYVKLYAPPESFSHAAVGWELTLPSASAYEYFYIKVYGRRSGGPGLNRFGAQDFAECAYSATADWEETCFGTWTTIPATSGTTNYTYRSPNLASNYRSGRKVRISVMTTGGTIYIYKAQVTVKYVILS